ncbi:MAG: undecaprenyl-diphosphate phosphatase [Patescibacteria group bacterium]
MNFSILNEYIAAVIVGIAQGLTEFLPISSTAHLSLISRLVLNGRDIGLSASNIIQLGTTIALLIYFRKDLKKFYNQLVKILTSSSERMNWWRDTLKWWSAKSHLKQLQEQNSVSHNSKYHNPTNVILSQLVLVTVPISFMGLILQNFIDDNLRSLGNIAVFLILGACLLLMAENLNSRLSLQKNKQNHPELEEEILSKDQVIIIGFFQSLAIFPGMSRSGSTIAGSLVMGLNRRTAGRFAFLAGIPALLISSLKDLLEVLIKGLQQFHFTPDAKFWDNPNAFDPRVNLSLSAILVAVIVSFIAGYFSLKWLIDFISKNSTNIFSYYRLGLAAFILIVLMIWR